MTDAESDAKAIGEAVTARPGERRPRCIRKRRHCACNAASVHRSLAPFTLSTTFAMAKSA